ncbi:MAG: hypothetical protein AABW90_00055 [Nanoarchaeota archaeon]
MKCAFKNCKNEVVSSKQFNDLVIRVYLCTDHLIEVAQLSSWQDGIKFIEKLKERK